MPAVPGVKPNSTTSGCSTCGRASIAGGCNGEGRMQVCLTLVNGTSRDLGPLPSTYRSPSHIGGCRRATGSMQGSCFPRIYGGSVTFRRVSAHISNWKVFRVILFLVVQGGIATIPGFRWWPIKVYRPCPDFIKAGGVYKRQGQSLDEVAFGRQRRGDDKSIQERLQGKGE